MKKHYDVVAAVIFHDGKYLCMQKGETKYSYTSYKYEFPGGKIELGETPEEALIRELHEEMSYDIVVIRPLIMVEHSYPDFSITLKAFLCSVKTTDFVMKEHINYKWLSKDELSLLDWADADVKIVNEIVL